MSETYYEAVTQDDGKVAALIEEIKALSPAARDAARVAKWDAEQGPVWDAARYAAWDAAWNARRSTTWNPEWDTAWYTAWYVAWDARRITTWDAEWNSAWEAVLATAVRDVISPEHYATLMAPMEAARAVTRKRPQ